MGGPEGEKTGAGSHGRELRFPADLYLEGSDQHRGWFHSSLLVSCMLNGRAPYNALLTHGFVVDGQGRKMSKSLGNVIAPQKISETLGAEILRLWVAATDYSGELFISDEILKRVVESYRRIRNTLRFLLANISDFDPKRDAIPMADWVEIDRYALALTAGMQAEILAGYEKFEFHPAAARLQAFCSEDLGAFYLDILKDRMYTCRANSPARRSAQNALYHITHSLLRLMAPILSFTAEEAWKTVQPGEETIFAHVYHRIPEVPGAEALLEKWRKLREIRSEVQKFLELLRAAAQIGSSLQAEVQITADGEKLELLRSLNDELRFLFITSQAVVTETVGVAEAPVYANPSPHPKCERCWHYRAEVGADPKHPGICGRCVANLFGPGEPRQFA
jgi:isoleucyl-tRNA synthetase